MYVDLSWLGSTERRCMDSQYKASPINDTSSSRGAPCSTNEALGRESWWYNHYIPRGLKHRIGLYKHEISDINHKAYFSTAYISTNLVMWVPNFGNEYLHFNHKIHVGLSGNVSGLYSGGSPFESRPSIMSEVFGGFPQSFHANAGTVTQNKPRPLP
jgi:hypothetical protein